MLSGTLQHCCLQHIKDVVSCAHESDELQSSNSPYSVSGVRCNAIIHRHEHKALLNSRSEFAAECCTLAYQDLKLAIHSWPFQLSHASALPVCTPLSSSLSVSAHSCSSKCTCNARRQSKLDILVSHFIFGTAACALRGFRGCCMTAVLSLAFCSPNWALGTLTGSATALWEWSEAAQSLQIFNFESYQSMLSTTALLAAGCQC